MKFIIIDVQFFSNQQIPKELCIFDGNKLGHFVFKPSTPYSHLTITEKKQIDWLYKNHLGIAYNKGFCNLNELKEILENHTIDTNYIFVKGVIKKEFLQHYLPHIKIINLENEQSAPKLKKSIPQCFYHEISECYCSINICKQLFEYVMTTRMYF